MAIILYVNQNIVRPVESSSSSMHWVNVWYLRPIGMEALKRDESLEYLDYLQTVVVQNCSMCTYICSFALLGTFYVA